MNEQHRRRHDHHHYYDNSREELFSTTKANGTEETSISIDGYATKENDKLLSFHQNVDDLLASGSNIISSLKDQRNTLTGVHRKVIDIGNSLGMSNTVMRLIEKRAYFDKFILFGLMFFFLVFMLLCWIYLM